MHWVKRKRRLIRLILMAAALSSNSGWATQATTISQPSSTLSFPPSGNSVPQPRIATTVVHVPVAEAKDRLGFRRISTSDGLSQTRVAQIVQDDLGFIWFGTQYGLNRYDGYQFKLFVHERGRTDSLSGAFITALFKDRSGFLWIGCSQVLDRFDPRTETFTP